MEKSWWLWACLAIVVGVLIWLTLRIRSAFWEEGDSAADDHQMLTQIGDLHRGGSLSEAEYRSIKGRLTDRMGAPPVESTEADSTN